MFAGLGILCINLTTTIVQGIVYMKKIYISKQFYILLYSIAWYSHPLSRSLSLSLSLCKYMYACMYTVHTLYRNHL